MGGRCILCGVGFGLWAKRVVLGWVDWVERSEGGKGEDWVENGKLLGVGWAAELGWGVKEGVNSTR